MIIKNFMKIKNFMIMKLMKKCEIWRNECQFGFVKKRKTLTKDDSNRMKVLMEKY